MATLLRSRASGIDAPEATQLCYRGSESWACAQHYVTKHGRDAAIIAAIRCDELMSASDFEGARNYQAIIEGINRLLEPPSGTLH